MTIGIKVVYNFAIKVRWFGCIMHRDVVMGFSIWMLDHGGEMNGLRDG